MFCQNVARLIYFWKIRNNNFLWFFFSTQNCSSNLLVWHVAQISPRKKRWSMYFSVEIKRYNLILFRFPIPIGPPEEEYWPFYIKRKALQLLWTIEQIMCRNVMALSQSISSLGSEHELSLHRENKLIQLNLRFRAFQLWWTYSSPFKPWLPTSSAA